MSAPVYSATTQANSPADWTSANASTTRTTPSYSPAAGTILVGCAGSEDYGIKTLSSISGGPSWTQQYLDNTNSKCGTALYTATAAGGAITSLVTSADVAAAKMGLAVLQFTGSDGVGAKNTAQGTTGYPSVSLTTTQANSAIVAIVTDWSATTGTSTFTAINGSNAVEVVDYADGSQYGVHIAYWPDVGAAGAKTVAMSAPSGQNWKILVIEVKGSSSQTFTHSGTGGAVTGGAAAKARTIVKSVSGGIVAGGAAAKARTIVKSVSGGIVTGGAAEKSLTRTYIGSGGASTGGAAATSFSRLFTQIASGGASTGGAATKSLIKTYIGSGGIVTGGAAAKSLTRTYIVSGGIVTGGAATKSLTFSHDASGGIVTGGSATNIRTFTHEASGGISAGGSASKSLTFSHEASGGIVASGSAGKTVTKGYVGVGGIVAGGSATTQFIPASGSGDIYLRGGGASTGDIVLSGSGSQTFTHTMAGGITAGGAAAKSWTHIYEAVGGITAGGTAEKLRTFAHLSSGGMVAGGAAAHEFSTAAAVFSHTMSGGVQTGGTAAKSRAITHEASGGLTAGGEATTVFSQPTSLPSETKLQSLEVVPPTLPALPALPAGLEPDLRRLLMSMKERLEIAGGDIASYGRTITYYDVATAPPGAFVNVPNDVYQTPPAPTGLSAAGAFTSVTFSWDMAAYYGHSHTEVWRYPTDNIGSATMNSIWYGAVGSDLTATGTGYYYWIRHVNKAGVPGPFNAVHGVFAATAPDVDFLLTSLEDKITEMQLKGEIVNGQEAFIFNTKLFAIYDPSNAEHKLPFAVVGSPFDNNGVNVPAGVYMRDAMIQNGAIVNAKIGNLAVDDAKIFNLSATKITAGDISAARMTTNFLAAAQATIDSLSAITANIGAIQAGIIGNSPLNFPSWSRYINLDHVNATNSWFIRSPNFELRGDGYVRIGGANATLVGGGMAVYAWPPSGQRGFYLGPEGFLVGNATDGSFFQWDANTNSAYCNGIQIFGNSIFHGSLQAATGTFTGALQAATGTFVGSLSAATGTFSGTLTADAVNAVNTINIAGNAVTVPIYIEVGASAPATIGWLGYHDIFSTGVQAYYGGTVSVHAMLDISIENAGYAYIQVLRDGGFLKQYNLGQALGYLGAPTPISKAFMFADAPGAGNHTYTIRLVNGTGSILSYTRNFASMLTLEVRR